MVGRVHKKQLGAVPAPGPEAVAPGLSSLPDLLCFTAGGPRWGRWMNNGLNAENSGACEILLSETVMCEWKPDY